MQFSDFLVTIPTVSVKTKTFFIEDRKQKIKRRKKLSTWSALCFAVFRKYSTSLQLVIHVVQNYQAREQELDAQREDKQRKLKLYICARALYLSCANPSLALRRQHGSINFTMPKVLLNYIKDYKLAVYLSQQFDTFLPKLKEECDYFQTRSHR